MTHKPSPFPSALLHFDSLPDTAFVRLNVVRELCGCSKTTIWRMVQRGELPPPRRLTSRVSAWNVGQLRVLLNGKEEAQ